MLTSIFWLFNNEYVLLLYSNKENGLFLHFCPLITYVILTPVILEGEGEV